jgi:hypothetical protein
MIVVVAAGRHDSPIDQLGHGVFGIGDRDRWFPTLRQCNCVLSPPFPKPTRLPHAEAGTDHGHEDETSEQQQP